ncbi:MAG: MFS transporter [Rhodospirillaceae bacterium]
MSGVHTIDRVKAALTPVRWLFGVPLALLLAAQLLLAFYAWGMFKLDMSPELDRKASVVADTVRERIAYALHNGVPFERIEGVESVFAKILQNNPDLAFLILTGPEGNPVHSQGNFSAQKGMLPSAGLSSPDERERIAVTSGDGYTISRAAIWIEGRLVGGVYVGVDRGYLDSKLGEIRFDLATVMLTSLLIAFELLLFVTTVSLSGPLRVMFALIGNVARGDFRHAARGGFRDEFANLAGVVNGTVERVTEAYLSLKQTAETLHAEVRLQASEILSALHRRHLLPESGRPISYRQPRLIHVRILTFLFTFAEMLSRPFMPIYVGQVAEPIAGVPTQILLGLPITVFMLVGAFGMPVAGAWITRMGQRNAYALGAVLSAVGLAGTGAAVSMADLLAWRVLSAVGYALMFMACQTYLIANSDETDRARSTAVFVGALMVAEICAPGIGGILADRIGFRLVFALGATVSVISAVLAWRIIYDNPERRRAQQNSGLPVRAFPLLARNPRFVILMLFAGMPAKILLTGFLYYLVPLFLTELGSTQSQIGRIAMVWGVASVVLMPVTARIADRYGCYGLLVGGGGILAGVGLIPVLLWPDANHVLLAVAALGVGQALSIAPQLALVTKVCAREIAMIGSAPVLGRYRLLERTGSAIGPFIASALDIYLGGAEAITALGILGAVSAAIFSLAFLLLGAEPRLKEVSP